VIVLYVPPIETQAPAIADAIVEAVRRIEGRVPVLSTFLSARGVPEELRSQEVRIPSYAFPEQSAIALARVAAYGAWRARPRGTPPTFHDVRPEVSAKILAEAAEGPGWLDPSDTIALLEAWRIPVVRTEHVPDPGAAGAAADAIGGVVVLKAAGEQIVHKSELGAVRLRLRGGDEVDARGRPRGRRRGRVVPRPASDRRRGRAVRRRRR
jgi:acyl-CoA synthetase (NDP forming)